MISFSRILIGVDLSHSDRLVSEELSDHCQQAVTRGIEYASAQGGEVTFFTTLEISEQARHLIDSHESKITESVEVEAARVLETLVQQAASQGVKASFKVAFGTSWTELIREAVVGKHTIVIVGRRGAHSQSRFFYGKTATKLIRKCPLPVLIAKPDPVREIESILVADDLSEIGETILDAGVQLARMGEAGLHVVHVVEDEGGSMHLFGGMTQEKVEQLKSELHDKADREINDRLSRTDYRTLTRGTKVHIESGAPEEVILDLLKSEGVDLMIIGSIGRSGLSAMVLGSTAERLLSTADSSLLVIKPDDFVCPVKID
ncbi:MAG: universal stress protein [Planctomycetaceae bacterium]|nr:universal stress protein [Planctomycetaceae bacterium]